MTSLCRNVSYSILSLSNSFLCQKVQLSGEWLFLWPKNYKESLIHFYNQMVCKSKSSIRHIHSLSKHCFKSLRDTLLKSNTFLKKFKTSQRTKDCLWNNSVKHCSEVSEKSTWCLFLSKTTFFSSKLNPAASITCLFTWLVLTTTPPLLTMLGVLNDTINDCHKRKTHLLMAILSLSFSFCIYNYHSFDVLTMLAKVPEQKQVFSF